MATLHGYAPPEIEGLWRYRTIAPGGGREVPIDGFIVFRAGRFVQQTLNIGAPYTQQVAQAHAGTYRVGGRHLELTADVGLVVSPSSQPPVETRHHSTHQLIVVRSGEALTLTFGSGTVQTLTWTGPSEGRIYALHEGALALVDGRFVLAAHADGHAVAGSGAFDRLGDALRLQPDRWFSIRGGRPQYAREPIVASFDDKILKIPGGPALSVKD